MSSYDVIICDSGKSIYQDDVKFVDVGNGFIDENGHGTKIINLIKLISPVTKIISIKILNRKNECNLEELLLALNKCNHIDAKVICLPLSIDKEKYNYELEESINNLYNNGKVIVCAKHNRMNNSIPARFRSTIGVQNGKYKNFKFYNTKNEIQCRILQNNAIVKSIDGKYSRISGNSLACALFTSHVINTIQKTKIYDFKKLEDIFNDENIDNLEFNKYFNKSNQDLDLQKYEYYKEKIYHITNCVDSYDKFDKFSLFNYIKTVKELNIFINDLERNGIIVNNNTILTIEDFRSIDEMIKYLYFQERHI